MKKGRFCAFASSIHLPALSRNSRSMSRRTAVSRRHFPSHEARAGQRRDAAGENRMPSRHQRGAAGCALRLDVVVGQQQTVSGKAIDIWCLRTKRIRTAVAAEVANADIVDMKHQNI